MHVVAPLDSNSGLVDYVGIGDECDRTIINTTSSTGTGGMPSWAGSFINDPTNPNCSTAVNGFGTAGLGGNGVAEDMDGDGKVDVMICDLDAVSVTTGSCTGGTPFLILRNRFINTSLPALQDLSTPNNYGAINVDGVFDVVTVDINTDGKPDVLMSTCEGLRMFVQI